MKSSSNEECEGELGDFVKVLEPESACEDLAVERLLSGIEVFLETAKPINPIETIKQIIKSERPESLSEEEIADIAKDIYKSHIGDVSDFYCCNYITRTPKEDGDLIPETDNAEFDVAKTKEKLKQMGPGPVKLSSQEVALVLAMTIKDLSGGDSEKTKEITKTLIMSEYRRGNKPMPSDEELNRIVPRGRTSGNKF